MRRWVVAAVAVAALATGLSAPVWHVDRDPVRPTVTYLPLSGVDAVALASAPAPAGGPATDVGAVAQAGIEVAGFDVHPAADHSHGPVVPLDVAVVTPEQETGRFDLVGVVADEPLDPATRILVRVRTDDSWSAWQHLPVSDHLPDPDSPEAVGVRSTSEPLVASGADAVQVRIDTPDGTVPAGTELALIDSPVTADDADLSSVPVSTVSAAAPQPRIITREQWGADESLVRGTPSFSDTIKVAFIHHVVSSNDYTPEEAAAQVRAVYSWFVEGVGVNDFGYNFMVDRFGRIYEGRKGSIEGAVIGAHTSGFNAESFAVSFLGNANTLNPSRAEAQPIIDAYAKIVAWKLSQYHRNPQGTAVLTSAGPGPGQGTTSMYWPGETVRVPTILGHGDIGSTACPGAFLKQSLAAIRTSVTARIGASFFTPTVIGRAWGADLPLVLRSRTNADIDYSVRVVNACGTAVRTLSGSVAAGTVMQAEWDGRNDAGRRVPPGTYRFELTGTSGGTPVTTWTGTGVISSTETSPPDPCAPPDAFVITGTGYGHGVGLSQWGALAMAREGWTAAQILRHYYTGTKVAPVPDDVALRVGLMSQVPIVRIRAEGDATLRVRLNARQVALAAGEIVHLSVRDGRVWVRVRTGDATRSLGTVARVGITWLPAMQDGDAVAEVVGPGEEFGSGGRYRRGSLEVGLSGSTPQLAVVSIVSLHDEYLFGIAEVTPTWPQAALQAQVIASRSYALDAYADGVRSDCLCHVNDGDAPYYDQTYRAADVEDGVGGDTWMAAVTATAADETSGRAVLYEGTPIRAFYTASTGGRTMSAEAVWGGTDYPWAVSVDDSWSLRVPENPYRTWTVTVDRDQMEQIVGIDDLMRLRVGARWSPGGSVRSFTAVGLSGETAPITAAQLRSTFGLKSAYITSVRGLSGVPVAPIERTVSLDVAPAAPKEGDTVTLTGTVAPQGVGLSVVRQVRYFGQSAWVERARAVTDSSGDFTFSIPNITSAGDTYSWRVVVVDGSTVLGTSPVRTVTVAARAP